MQLSANVFDVWAFRRTAEGIRFLLLHTSVDKAERFFNGGRFWQIPSDVLKEGEHITDGIARNRRHLVRAGYRRSGGSGRLQSEHHLYKQRMGPTTGNLDHAVGIPQGRSRK